MISLPSKIGEIFDLKGHMMHFDSIHTSERETMVIRITTHPDKDIVHPIGHPKAQHLAIEIDGLFTIGDLQSHMTKLTRLNCSHPIVRTHLCHSTNQLDNIA